jgi:deoxycytidylate deaminase
MQLLKNNQMPTNILSDLVLIASGSTCKRSKCGSIIIANNRPLWIGTGFNSQPCNVDAPCFKDSLPTNFKSDRTCCVHAEQRAIMDALKNYPHMVRDSTLWFIRLDENDQPKPSGDPYCTICSKMALDAHISKFMLWHKDGWTEYDTKEYNELSFQHKTE